MLSHAPIVQPPDWLQPSHVFVNATDVAIDSALMQKMGLRIGIPQSTTLVVGSIWHVTEWEAVDMIYKITKSQHYLLG